MVKMTPRHVGELSRLYYLLHVVAFPSLGNTVIEYPSPTDPEEVECLTVDYPRLLGDEVEGRLAAGCGQGFFVIAWGEPGVVATVYEPGEVGDTATEALADIRAKRPELKNEVASVLDFFVSTGGLDAATASYWSTRQLSSELDVTRVGGEQPLAWYGRELAEAKAWVTAPASPLAGIPLALRELALHLFASSQTSRYTLTEAEVALLLDAQRQHCTTARGLARLVDAARRLSLARIDWTPSPTALRELLPGPPAPIQETLDAATVDLHYAVALGDIVSVRALLEAGADPNALGWEGEFGEEARRPLNLAWEALNGTEGCYADVARVLLQHGADPLRAWSIEQLFGIASFPPTVFDQLSRTILKAAWQINADAFVDHVVRSEEYTGNLVELLLDGGVPFDEPRQVERIAEKLKACGEEVMLKRFLAHTAS